MKNKGFTLVELLVSLGIASVTLFMLFQIVFLIRNIYLESGIKVKLLQKQMIINEKVNDDFNNKELIMARKCSDTCVELTFKDGEVKKIEYDRTEKTFKYGDFVTKLDGQSVFGNININTEKSYDETTFENDAILIIDIPVYNELFQGQNFGLKVVYQYDSKIVSVESLTITDNITSKKQIYLIGSSDYVMYTTMTYEEPGYYLRDETGALIENSNEVDISGTVLSTPGEYEILYTYKDSLGVVVDTKVRKIKVLDGIANFEYKGACEEYIVPASGLYKLEVWGAMGGSSNEYSLGGTGAYTSGYQNLKANELIYVCVGGKGSPGSTVDVLGGFNGGGISLGASEGAGGSGGGATDIRTSESFNDTIIVAGGGGGSSSKNDSSITSVGGFGDGGTGTYETISYNGFGATQIEGGSAAAYVENVTKIQTSGTKLVGGTSGLYLNTYSGGAGGGGYFGGGAGVRYGTGGGGSSYCGNTISCMRYKGNETFKLPDGTSSVGNNSDGYARITLISLEN